MTTAELLHTLDPDVAVAKLETVVQRPGPTMTSRRRLTAVVELTKHEPERARHLTTLANGLAGEPQDRLDTAALISTTTRKQLHRLLDK